MNCWKTISIDHEFGRERLWFMSISMALLYFIFFFVSFRTFYSAPPLMDYGLGFLLFSLAVIIPLHLILHCLPLWIAGKKATFGVRRKFWPFFYYSSKGPLSKQLAITSICAPILVITLVSISAVIIFPEWLHYIAMMSALNFGLCMYDLLTLKHLRTAPKKAYFEEHRDGYHILYNNQNIK
ncbi:MULTISPECIES: DUF3267 domain-containing protein [Bacillaceae]|uniref:DUF3267 domain-containing protein n=1 Tax=Evansella alkalicola TaxID=745819 RepID=A0ABS6JQ94_9BACI|nr:MULTISPECIES: DUF3267 domain-containing protein [Bacillaceae]MBU9720724.1 DUF3267 domain-containing protein [Bacillus alkalicola]